ncbi:MAG TPA: diguanylate cyclase [Solirubrobacteraceae bacterium]|jgi:diguanylate cyclase (GGDEF)-like protein/PAS domain S-box-containing protein
MATARQTAPNALLAGIDDAATLVGTDELAEALIMVFDADLRFTLVAGRAARRGAENAAYREGAPLAQAFPAEIWREIEPLCRSALDGDTRSRKIRTRDGSHRLAIDVGPLSVHKPPAPAVIAGGVAVVLDVSPATATDRGEPPAPERFEQVFERAPIGTGLLDQDGRWVLVNHALCDITGYTADELIGQRFGDITHPEDVTNDAARRQQLLDGEISAFQTEKRYVNAAGETMSALLSISLVRDHHGAPLHFIVQVQDISERKHLEEHLRHLADHDPLTGLRNRRLFEHDLRLQIGRCQRYAEQAALLAIDLDGFKAVNDVHGHKVGDDALKAVARTLTRRLRATDLVARLGGDEFAVLLPHMTADGAQIVVEDLMRVIEACAVDTGDSVVHLAGSVGYALIDSDTASDEDVLVAADRAMYAVKRARAAARVPAL